MSQLKHLERDNIVRLQQFRPGPYVTRWLDHGIVSKPEAAAFAAAQAFNIASYLLNGPRGKANASGKDLMIPYPQQMAFTTQQAANVFSCVIKCIDHLGDYREVTHAKTGTGGTLSRVDAVIPWIILDIVFKTFSHPTDTVSLGIDHGGFANYRFPIPWRIQHENEIAAVQLLKLAVGWVTTQPSFSGIAEGAFFTAPVAGGIDFNAKTVLVAMGTRTEPVGTAPAFKFLHHEIAIYPGRNARIFDGVIPRNIP